MRQANLSLGTPGSFRLFIGQSWGWDSKGSWEVEHFSCLPS